MYVIDLATNHYPFAMQLTIELCNQSDVNAIRYIQRMVEKERDINSDDQSDRMFFTLVAKMRNHDGIMEMSIKSVKHSSKRDNDITQDFDEFEWVTYTRMLQFMGPYPPSILKCEYDPEDHTESQPSLVWLGIIVRRVHKPNDKQ